MDRETYRRTERYIDGQRDIQTERETYRRTEIYTEG